MTALVENLAPGTLPQWGTFASMLTMLVMLGTVYIKGLPERLRARTEDRRLFGHQYAQQVRDYRAEVAMYRREVEALGRRVNLAEAMSARRGHHISQMTFILRLLMGELRRIDPDSAVLAQAEALLAEMEAESERNTRMAIAARKTMEAAAETVALVDGENEAEQ